MRKRTEKGAPLYGGIACVNVGYVNAFRALSILDRSSVPTVIVAVVFGSGKLPYLRLYGLVRLDESVGTGTDLR